MAESNGQRTNSDLNKNARPHTLSIENLVCVANDFVIVKNPKLATKWKGPAQIIDINDMNAKNRLNYKIVVLSH
jgi:hypothetical protein